LPETARGVGASIPRPDGPAKVEGGFTFASDLVAPGMIYGKTLRSPHPRALLRRLDTTAALRMPGVRAVLTAADVPGAPRYSIHDEKDQPVLVGVGEEVRYAGEPVAVIAADHPEQALQAARAIEVEYEELQPLTDPVEALRRGESHRILVIRHGSVPDTAEVVVEGYYEVGQQDQAPLGPEAGLAVPGAGGREVELWIATQALHVDLEQVADCLALPLERIRLRLSGVGGAFGAREDLSVQIHACLLALRTGRPVKMWYGREESFWGHVHRHPARMWYAHGATRDGDLVFVRATIVLDGGAYASTSAAVTANAACFGAGPYRVPSALVWCGAARTNQVPNGAMRGFGAVQSCFGYESQMDALAARLGMDPVALRLRNALRTGDRMITGQVLDGAVPMEELIRRCLEIPLPAEPGQALERPGGAGNISQPRHVRRGTGLAIGYKNIAYSEGSDDSAVARVRLERRGEEPVALVKTAAVEVGQGLVTVLQQIVRTELGVEEVELEPPDTSIGDAGSSSASRQTWMSGGAVQQAARLVRGEVLRRAGPPGRGLGGGHVLDDEGSPIAPLALLLEEPVEMEFEFHHRPTSALDENGQGAAHVSFMFVAQRAVVDVDPEAGLARVAQVATAQDVGRAINPLQVHGQIEGAIAQGVGLATMEEIQVKGGLIRNASFTDYLLPTALDMPAIESVLLEDAEPGAPYGAKGVGEPPLIASPPAIVAAMRQATGRRLGRLPVRPDELAGLAETEPERWIEPGSAP
jgi:xanthine dehydrogenase D subunit